MTEATSEPDSYAPADLATGPEVERYDSGSPDVHDLEGPDVLQMVPPGCDLFEINPADIERLTSKGKDPRISVIRVWKWVNGERDRKPGEWPVEETSTRWLVSRWGAGLYDVHGMSRSGEFRKSARMRVGGDDKPAPAAAPAGPLSGLAGTMGELIPILTVLKELGIVGRQDPLREAVGSMVSCMSAMQQMWLARSAEEGKPGGEMIGLMREMMTKTLALRANPQPAQMGGDMATVLQMLELGAKMAGKRGSSVTSEPERSTGEIVADSLQPIALPLVAVLARAIPEQFRGEFFQILQKSADAAAVTTAGETVDAA